MKKFFMPVFLVIFLASTAFCEDDVLTGNLSTIDLTEKSSITLGDCTINFGDNYNFQLADGAVVQINGTVTVNTHRAPLFELHGNATFTGSGKIVSNCQKTIINDEVVNKTAHANYSVTISGITIVQKEENMALGFIGCSLTLADGAKIISESTSKAVVQLRYGGTFSMEDGCSVDGGETGLALWNGPNATITGGTIKGKSYGVRFNTGGSLTMTGGTISGGKYEICYRKPDAPFASGTVTLGNSATLGEGNIHIGGNNTITIQDG